VNVPVQPWVIRKDLQAAANEQDDEEKVDVMGDTQPRRKSERLSRRFGRHCEADRQHGQADNRPLDIGRRNRQQKRGDDQQQYSGPCTQDSEE